MSAAWVKRVAMVLAVTTLTSGCIMYRLEELRNTTPQGTPFQNALAQRYMDFAAQEEKDYDWQNSWYFADKGLMLAYGKDTGPEELGNWNIPDEALSDLVNARTRLMELLTPRFIQESPTRAADAQFYFDCWVEQQEENWQTEDIDFCRSHFMDAIGGLESGEAMPSEAPSNPKPVAKKKPQPIKAVAPKKVMETVPEAKEEVKTEPAPEPVNTHAEMISYAVFFEAGKAQLSAPGENVIGEVADSLKHVSSYEIVLHGGASKTVNALLADERAQAVKKRLIESGLSAQSIKLPGAPENTSAAKAARRIEIFLNE